MADEPESTEAGVAARKSRYLARHRRARWWRRGRSPSGARRTPARCLLIGVNLIAGLALVVAALGATYAEIQLHRIKKVHVAGLVPPGRSTPSPGLRPGADHSPPITILLVGSDSRAALHKPGDSQFGSAADVGGARSDTIIVVRVVPATRQIALLSIPRDLLVPIPGMGDQRINEAINTSPNLLIQVLHDQLHIDINHYIDVDFDSFRQIADAVGGVQVYFPTAARDSYSNLSIPAAGCYNLAGDQALAFVRSREYEYYADGQYHQEPLSDLARIQRQQIFIRKLINKAETAGLTSPFKLNGIISGLTKNVTVDDSFSVGNMVQLVKDFSSVNAAIIPGLTLDTTDTTLSDGAQVLLPQPASDRAQIQQLLALGTSPSGTSPRAATGSPLTAGPPSTSPATTTTVPVPATVDPSTVSVEVVNGSGVAGQAGQAATDLQAIGFNVASVASAGSYGPGPTQVFSGAGGSGAAKTVADHIGGPTSFEVDSSLSSTTVRVVTGGDFTGVSAATHPRSTPSPSTPAPSSPAPATSTTTTYVLPGTPPEQPRPTCGS